MNWHQLDTWEVGKESWQTDVFFALCDSLVEKSHTWPFKFAQMQPVISFLTSVQPVFETIVVCCLFPC